MAVMVFNSGMKPSATLLQRIGHECNPSSLLYLSEMDDKRIYRAEVKDQEGERWDGQGVFDGVTSGRGGCHLWCWDF